MEQNRVIEIASDFAHSKGYTVEAQGQALLVTEAEGRTSAFVEEKNFWRWIERVAIRQCPIPGEILG